MDEKGFTLLELIATITILSLIMLIAVPSVNNVNLAIRKKNRENSIKNIEIAASKYAFDTNETLIFVDKLITEGYIEGDNDGNILDAVNNERLNCYVVEMTKENDYYTAKFLDDKNYDNDGVCDLDKLKELNEEVSIEVLNNGLKVNDSEWVKGDISLRVYSNSVNIDCNNHKCLWTSSSGAYQEGVSEIDLNNINGLLETRYNFQMTIVNEEDNIKRYNASVELKIDNEKPTIYEKEIKVTDKFINTDTKTVEIVASDGKGSGISGYYLGINTNSCYNEDLEYQSSNIFVVDTAGDYLICVKDSVGNISSLNNFQLNNFN